MNDALLKVLGIPDSRSLTGILSRGANVYKGASMSAHRGGGPQFGRPKKNQISQGAIRRRRMR